MNTTNLTSQDIVDQFADSVKGATDKIISLAQEDQSPEAQEFVAVATMSSHREDIEAYVFEILKAFGCCAQMIAADDDHSRKQMASLELKHPSLRWVKNAYKEGVALEDVNEDLANNKQDQLLAHERFDQWLS